jgi:hypothetical protein
MESELIGLILEKGLLGVLLVAMGYAYNRERDRANKANEQVRLAEKSRTEDAHKVATMLLSQQEKTGATMGTVAMAMEGHSSAIRALEQEIRTFATIARSR